MKRPPSVITTLILFSLFTLLGILLVVKNAPHEIAALLVGSIMPSLFLIGWVGIYLKKNWSPIYCAILIFLFGLAMVVLPFINKAEKNKGNETLILMVVVFAFMLWWAFSLLMGKASRKYFRGNENA